MRIIIIIKCIIIYVGTGRTIIIIIIYTGFFFILREHSPGFRIKLYGVMTTGRGEKSEITGTLKQQNYYFPLSRSSSKNAEFIEQDRRLRVRRMVVPSKTACPFSAKVYQQQFQRHRRSQLYGSHFRRSLFVSRSSSSAGADWLVNEWSSNPSCETTENRPECSVNVSPFPPASVHGENLWRARRFIPTCSNVSLERAILRGFFFPFSFI